mgnify:CR=1 FL=1
MEKIKNTCKIWEYIYTISRDRLYQKIPKEELEDALDDRDDDGDMGMEGPDGDDDDRGGDLSDEDKDRIRELYHKYC